MSHTQIKDAVNKHSRVLENYEKILHHDQLVQNNVKHTYGVRKNVHGGHEFFLIENLEKLSFKNGLKHPSEILKRLANLISRIKTAIYQKLRIDVSNDKNRDYVKGLEDRVITTVKGLSGKYPDLKPFSDLVGGNTGAANSQALIQERDALKQANTTLAARNHVLENGEAADNADLLDQVEELTERVRALNDTITANAISKESLEERIRRLQTKVNTSKQKIDRLEGRSTEGSSLDNKLAEHHHSITEEFKKALSSLSGHVLHPSTIAGGTAPKAGDGPDATAAPKEHKSGNVLTRGASSLLGFGKKHDKAAKKDAKPADASTANVIVVDDSATTDAAAPTVEKKKKHRHHRPKSATNLTTGTGE